MGGRSLAEFCLLLMPAGFGFKTVVFLILATILSFQTSTGPLGRWLTAFFWATFCASTVVTYLTWYLYVIADGANIDTAQEWAIVLAVDLVPWGVTVTGMFVAWFNFRAEHPGAAA